MTREDIFALDIPADFGMDYDYCEDCDAIHHVRTQLEDVDWSNGASKFVIFLNEAEVIKIPFNGIFETDPDDESNTSFEPFSYCRDYCAVEAALYEDAVAAGIGHFFAGTRYIGTSASGTPLYSAERVNSFYSEARHKSQASPASVEKAKSCGRIYLNVAWIAAAIERYSKEEVNKLLDFIEEKDISDLSCNNIGFREDGDPVIFDYSSFRENY